MVPAFVFGLGMEQKQAVATSMAAVVVTAIVATANNMRTDQLINWKAVLIVAISATLFSRNDSHSMKQLSSPMLSKILAVLM
jgi:uncharacterized membrane protein YfcA